MNKTIIYSLLAVFLCLSFANCGDEDVNSPRGTDEVPAQIDINTIRIKDLSGTSYIYYERPNDRNLKYVQAVYTLADGTERKFNASYFTDSIVVDGFPKEGEYDVKLYSVSYAEKRSEPVVVKVHPEQPPYEKVLTDCKVEDTFSGFRFISKDEVGTDLSIIFLKQLDNKDWEEISAYYTRKSNSLLHIVRGMESQETKIGIYATDKWGHKSDTTYVTVTPWYEIEIPKKNPLWKNMALPGDAEMHSWGSSSHIAVEKLWDGITVEVAGNDAWNTCYHTIPGTGLPKWSSIDLGAKYVFSRVVFHWRGGTTSSAFSNYTPKVLEIYGSNNPTMSGEWDDSWTKLETFNIVREDGSQTPQSDMALTANEKLQAAEGYNLDFPVGIEAYRYVRLKIISTYGGLDYTAIGEMTLYGQEPEE